MEASVVDLRYKMKEVLEALERSEEIKILYHGKVKGIIRPVKDWKENSTRKVQNHPIFGMLKTEKTTDEIMNDLRGKRY